ncbi:MAG TPA: hypothetical protein VGY13_10990 [Solirubrobacteraceae bacterium]|jgi:hypothetical protein|nr:hypothetical protein [Solirubrobacteraceae bacterium]
MFCPLRTKLAQRTFAALRLARSFLLLEDDNTAVDWEVDEDEPIRQAHAHRAPLRSRRPARRPGAPAPTCHVCLCPVERRGTLSSRASARRTPATGGSAGGSAGAGAPERPASAAHHVH